MLKSSKVPCFVCVFVMVCAFFLVQTEGAEGVAKRTESHTVQLPQSEGEAVVTCSVVSVLDSAGYPVEYYMDVPSVSCGSQVCAIVTVRLFWDVLGGYIRYELSDADQLTKADHAPFTRADHAKLQSILSDVDSPLKSIRETKVVAHDRGPEEVDGMTGATALTHKNAVVSGAAYTCFTLWHWANGPIQQIIKQMTAHDSSNDILVHYLNSNIEKQMLFAIEELGRRKVCDRDTLDVVVSRATCGSNMMLRAMLEYLKGSSTKDQADLYYRVVGELFPKAEKRQRVVFLDSLLKAKQEPPSGYYDQVAEWLPLLDSYYEVNLALNLIESRGSCSAVVVDHAISLLEKGSFFAARRAYYYLVDQEMTDLQVQALNIFKLQNSDRL